MSTETLLRLEVASPELLLRLAEEPLPLGLRTAPAVRGFHRDIYLDAPDGELQRRGVTCRFRISMDDTRTLTVTIRETVGVGALVDWQRFESEVIEVDPIGALNGTSEPARRLRAVLDPRRCGVRVELETERRTRIARSALLPFKTFDIAYDRLSVRSGSLTRGFQEIRIRKLRRGGPQLNELGNRIQEISGIHPVSASRLERAEELLSAMGEEPPVAVGATIPEVVLVSLCEGHVALHLTRDSLSLPIREGTGDIAVSELAQRTLGLGAVEFQLLDTVAATPESPALEVWSVEGSAGDPERLLESGMVWVSAEDVCSLAGSPALRDPKTLGALSLLVRSHGPGAELCGWSEYAAAAGKLNPGFSRRQLWTPPGPEDDSAIKRKDPAHCLNQEMSWLQFNQRLIELAEDATVPLLARLRFLAIFSSNIDEFFMVRVGHLKRGLVDGMTEPDWDGMGIHEQLDAVAIRLRYLFARQKRCLDLLCLPELTQHGIRIVPWNRLSEEQRAHLKRYFDEQLFPLLTPHAITRAPGHPFPHISNLSLSLAVMVRDADSGRLRFGAITLPEGVRRFVQLFDSSDFVLLEDVVRYNIGALYPGRQVEAAHCFRVTRAGDLEIDEEHADDLLEAIEEEVKRRPFAGVVRLEIERSMPRELRELLQRELQLLGGGRATGPGATGIYEVDGMLDLRSLDELSELGPPELDYPEFGGVPSVSLERSIFEVISEGDVLVHHPYDSFEHSTQRLFEAAARDPNVEDVKLTLYRAGGRSPIVAALIKAAEAGKRVHVFVELKARFDEERNVGWTRQLEAAGIHVVYGLVHVKTHAKTALIVRREGKKLTRYVHVGTGNYNAQTARSYSDLGLMTCDPEIGSDVADLFNELLGSSEAPRTKFKQLLVAPATMMKRFRGLIDREIEHAKAGLGGHIRVKLNGLADAKMVRHLYRASQAGVDVDLIVRSICTLRPGVQGLSDRIRVVAHLGRFLEHARIFHFANGGEDEYYIGSADWRPRNLRRRIEVVTPVRDETACARLDRILETELSDPGAWDLQSDGSYIRRVSQAGTELQSAQEVFMRWTSSPKTGG